MVSDNIQIPIDKLRQTGQELTSMGSELTTYDSKISSLTGYDDIHGKRLHQAVETFMLDWLKKRQSAFHNVSKIGSLSNRVADATQHLDMDIGIGFLTTSEEMPHFGGTGM